MRKRQEGRSNRRFLNPDPGLKSERTSLIFAQTEPNMSLPKFKRRNARPKSTWTKTSEGDDPLKYLQRGPAAMIADRPLRRSQSPQEELHSGQVSDPRAEASYTRSSCCLFTHHPLSIFTHAAEHDCVLFLIAPSSIHLCRWFLSSPSVPLVPPSP